MCLRLPEELKSEIQRVAQSMGLSISEWCRGLFVDTLAIMAQQGFTADIPGMIQGARQHGVEMARVALESALASLPATYAEFEAQRAAAQAAFETTEGYPPQDPEGYPQTEWVEGYDPNYPDDDSSGTGNEGGPDGG